MKPQVAYEFANFRLLPREKQLVCGDRAVKLQPKVFDTLLMLVENHGRLVDKDNFLKGLWPDTFVEEATLAHCVSELRRTLRAGERRHRVHRDRRQARLPFLAPVKTTELSAPVAATGTVLAVLPFENLGPETEREYLADGLTEEVIAALGQIDPVRLSVIGRTTIMRYKRTTKSLQEIGHELRAAFLVESSLRSEGGRIRVTSKLVRASDQVQIWSATYDSEPKSMLAFQRELSTTIAQQIRLRLSPERLDALARRQAHNPEAYDAYLQGRYYWNLFTPATTRKAIECYLRATQLDPNYALAWSGLADAYASSPIHADARPRDVWEKARQRSGTGDCGGTGTGGDTDVVGICEVLAGLGLERRQRRHIAERLRSIRTTRWCTGCWESCWDMRGIAKKRRGRRWSGRGRSIRCRRCIMRFRRRWRFWGGTSRRRSNLRDRHRWCCRISGLRICRWRRHTSSSASMNWR